MDDAQRHYDEDWLGATFSTAVFVGNGLMAILSGLAAHTLVEALALGPIAPFDAAHAVLLVGGVVILTTWTENYGDESGERKVSFWGQIWAALRAIRKGRHLMQSPQGSPCVASDMCLQSTLWQTLCLAPCPSGWYHG